MAKLLIVDDDPFITESLKVGLRERGHDVFAGHNGREGVRLVDQLMPDLVIIDMTMPIMDGFEATQQIRQLSDVPIIMLTAETDEEDIVAALETGVDEYLSKPFRLNELAARVQALIRRRDWAAVQTQKEISRLKTNMLSTMTHEMRTPIATILNTLEIALGATYKDNLPSQLSFLEQVQRNTNVLHRLVEDLIILSQIDEGLNILRRPLNLSIEMNRVIERLNWQYNQEQLEFNNEIDPSLVFNGDVNLLRHLLHHLADNAIKFGQAENSIDISAQIYGEGNLELVIADRGIGIQAEHLENIFDRFYQIDQGDNRAFGGLGLGLAIVKAVAQAHGGTISVISQKESGSQFIVNLPGAEAEWQV